MAERYLKRVFGKVSNAIKAERMKKRLWQASFVCIGLACIWLSGERLTDLLRESMGDDAVEEGGFEDLTEEELDEYAFSHEMDDYIGEEAFINPEDESGYDSEAGAGDNMLAQDFYDDHGNLAWKGLSGEEALHPSKAQMQAFEKAYKKWGDAVAEESEETGIGVERDQSLAYQLKKLVCEYNERIPYSPDSFDYYWGYLKKESQDNTPYMADGGRGPGLGGLGYVTWVMRNVMGRTPEALKGEKFTPSKATSVEAGELKPGDICVENGRYGKRYGIVIGRFGDGPVTTVCDGMTSEKFVTGGNHYANISSLCDDYIGNYASIDYDEFYRLGEWEGENE